MKKNELILRGDGEGLGKLYLKNTVDFALKGDFGKAFAFLKEGLDIVTCDCNSGGWLQGYSKSDKKLFNDIEINYQPYYEYFLVKAFIMSYEKEKKYLYFALDAIEKYLEINMDEYGLYVKGKVYLALDEIMEALNCFELAYKINPTSKLKYRIGRLKEQNLGEFGLDNLYSAFVSNPSSACCIRVLRKYSKIRNLVLPKSKNEVNELILAFDQSGEEWQFQKRYEAAFAANSSLFVNNQMSIINDFVSFLINCSSMFIFEKRETMIEKGYMDYIYELSKKNSIYDYGDDWTRNITDRDAFDTDEQYNDWLES